MFRQLFPLGKAYGEAFCNRRAETKLLAGNIVNGKHTLLIAPRRYGKSSLAEKAIQETGLPYVVTNFHLCTSEKEVAELIKTMVIKLIDESVGTVSALLPLIQKFLKTLRPRVSFFKDMATLELVTEGDENYAVTISESLLLLDKLLGEKGKKAALFLDEFQEISVMSKSSNIEGAIRTAAQELKNVSLIFSGSIRSLLLKMFEDESRPLYKLCRKIHLKRISVKDYTGHIQSIAKQTWGKVLSREALDEIFVLSNRHPYYINYLCDTLWQLSENLPGKSDVSHAWKQVIAEEWSDAVREISLMPMVQRRVMKYIASGHTTSLLAQSTTAKMELAVSSVSTALGVLTEKDYIEVNELGEYLIINPLLRDALRGVLSGSQPTS